MTRTKAKEIMTNLAQRAGFVIAAAALTTGLVAGTAFAYFTDQTYADGAKTLNLEYSTDIDEDLDGLDKHITMTNTGTTEVLVRVQLFYGNGTGLDVTVDVPGEGSGEDWTFAGDDANGAHIWNYEKALAPGESTDPLIVKVTANQSVTDYSIIVIGQTSPVVYDDNKEPQALLWADEAQGDQGGQASQGEPSEQA